MAAAFGAECSPRGKASTGSRPADASTSYANDWSCEPSIPYMPTRTTGPVQLPSLRHGDGNPPSPTDDQPVGILIFRRLTVACDAACRQLLLASQQAIEAIRAGSVGSHEEKKEAVGHGELALVHDGPEAVWRVHLEVSHGHLAAGQKRRDAGEQSEGDQQAAAELDDSGGQHQRVAEHARAARHSEQLLSAVASIEKRNDHSCKKEGEIRNPAAIVGHNRYIIARTRVVPEVIGEVPILSAL